MLDYKPTAVVAHKSADMVNQAQRLLQNTTKGCAAGLWNAVPSQDELSQKRRNYREHPGHVKLAIEFLCFNRYGLQLRKLYSETLRALDDISSTCVIPRGEKPLHVLSTDFNIDPQIKLMNDSFQSLFGN